MPQSNMFKTPKYKRGITLKDNGNTDASVVRRSAFAIADRLPDFSFRNPVAEDAQAIHDLIAACPPLDTNSLYCNLLQCTHFAETCVLAERDGEISRSEEHTSELVTNAHLVCRLLLEKKKKKNTQQET